MSPVIDVLSEVDQDDPPAAGLPWRRVIALVVATAFLGGAFGYWLNRDDPPSRSSVDVGFYKDMTHHHEQAVVMALIEERNGQDPVALSFADEIIRSQTFEMGVMAEQLRSWGYDATPAERAMAWMGMPTPIDDMPGMATPTQLQQLKDARGTDADALFLELMAEHHRGGVHMATYAYEHAGSSAVRTWAQRMAYNQAVEINEFRRMAQRQGIPADIEAARIPVPHPA
jgi:uncharacterized protein (DUF305 family)